MSDRRSGFGPGFSKDVEAVLTALQLGVIYPSEARGNLRIAGMDLHNTAEMPDFDPEIEEDPYEEPEEEPEDE